MSLLSSRDKIDVRVELLADDVWETDYDKTCFLSVGVNSSDQLFLKNGQFPCPWWKLVLKIKNMINEDKWESWTNQKMRFLFMNDRVFLLDPPMKRIEKSKNVKLLILMNVIILFDGLLFN